MTGLKAFTVKAHWGLLIRSGLKTVENRSFHVPPGFYLVHASSSLSYSEWSEGRDWVRGRFGSSVAFPGYEESQVWCGQVLCGVRVLGAVSFCGDPWFVGGDKLAWELGAVVPCFPGVAAKGALGLWPVSDELHRLYLGAVSAFQCTEKGVRDGQGL